MKLFVTKQAPGKFYNSEGVVQLISKLMPIVNLYHTIICKYRTQYITKSLYILTFSRAVVTSIPSFDTDTNVSMSPFLAAVSIL